MFSTAKRRQVTLTMTDKAVSTEDLTTTACIIEDVDLRVRNVSLDAARLEAVLKTLVDNKVEALKNKKRRRKSSSITSSPKSLVNRLRITSTSSVSSKDKDEGSLHSQTSKTGGVLREPHCQCDEVVVTTSSPSSKKRHPGGGGDAAAGHDDRPRSPTLKKSEVGLAAQQECSAGDNNRPLHSHNEESIESTNENYGYVHKDVCGEHHHRQQQQCQYSNDAMLDCSETCFCTRESNGEIHMHFDEDYISLKIEEDEIDLEQGLDHHHHHHHSSNEHSSSIRRAAQRKKRRRRRKRRMKRNAGRGGLNASSVAIPIAVNEKYRVIDPDELSKRARWTIVITACLLMFMCLFLVGVTLRMAPIIDDMVRKENEELMNSLGAGNGDTTSSNHQSISLQNLTASVPLNSK